MWELETGQVIRAFEGHSGAITPDGSRIVSGGQDATARVWDARSGRVTNTFTEHTGGVVAVVVTRRHARVDRLDRSNDQSLGSSLGETATRVDRPRQLRSGPGSDIGQPIGGVWLRRLHIARMGY